MSKKGFQPIMNRAMYSSIEKNVFKAFEAGKAEGRREAAPYLVRKFYAAAVITLRHLHGYGGKRALRFLKECENNWLLCIDDDELVEKVLKETGIELRLEETFTDDRITEAE